MFLFFLAIVISVVVVIRSAAPMEKEVTVFTFPPLSCINLGSTFYNGIIPTSVTALICISMVAKISWVIHKVRLKL